MSTFELAFDIEAASCHQVIEIIDDTYSEESIMEGLQDGSIQTSTWHNQGMSSSGETNFVTVLETGKNIAVVKDQEIDGEYSEFR